MKLGKLSRKQSINENASHKISGISWEYLGMRLLDTGRQLGDFHHNFSCRNFFLLPMTTKMVAAWNTVMTLCVNCIMGLR